jgi:hypothetical protein
MNTRQAYIRNSHDTANFDAESVYIEREVNSIYQEMKEERYDATYPEAVKEFTRRYEQYTPSPEDLEELGKVPYSPS